MNKRHVVDLGLVSADLVSGSSSIMTGYQKPLGRGREVT